MCLVALLLTSSFADDMQWQDFENNVYIGGAYSINNASVTQFGTSSTNSGVLNLGATALFDNKLYVKLAGTANFNSGGNFVGGWYNTDLKFGYALYTAQFNFIPYVLYGYGNGGAYYSTAQNFNYGLGLLTELMVSSQLLIYADLNYQWQNFSGQINADFNKNVLNNYTSYNLNGIPTTYGIDFGIKFITDGGYYINPFFKYQNYQQSFSQSGSIINYGTLNPAVSQYQVGINFGLTI